MFWVDWEENFVLGGSTFKSLITKEQEKSCFPFYSNLVLSNFSCSNADNTLKWYRNDPLFWTCFVSVMKQCHFYVRWAVSSVMTRQNQIPTADGSRVTLALIPLWDMCNHTNGLVSLKCCFQNEYRTPHQKSFMGSKKLLQPIQFNHFYINSSMMFTVFSLVLQSSTGKTIFF